MSGTLADPPSVKIKPNLFIITGILHADQPVPAFETNSLMIGLARSKSAVTPKRMDPKN
jgi:hypothetical protein